jgi:hypothetical protein
MGSQKPRRAIALAASMLILLAAVSVYAVVGPYFRPWSGSGRVEPDYIQTALRELSIPFQIATPSADNSEPTQDSEVKLASPVATCLASSRPSFEWRDDRSGSSYKVSIYSGPHELVESDPVSDKHWTPPIDLPEDQELIWYVHDVDRTYRVSPQARFRILSSTQQRRLQNDLEATAGRSLSHAIVLAAYGLTDQALTEFARSKDPRARIFESSILEKRNSSRMQ